LSFTLPGDLAESNKRADALATKLKQSEQARKKAEADAAAVEDLRKRLHDAETSLSDNIAQQSARETEILTRLQSQSRRFVSKYSYLFYFFGSSISSCLASDKLFCDSLRENAARL
jgi:septal ring factor EnvC (AmiA/AmiB activator)